MFCFVCVCEFIFPLLSIITTPLHFTTQFHPLPSPHPPSNTLHPAATACTCTCTCTYGRHVCILPAPCTYCLHLHLHLHLHLLPAPCTYCLHLLPAPIACTCIYLQHLGISVFSSRNLMHFYSTMEQVFFPLGT